MCEIGKLEIHREDYRHKWSIKFNLQELFFGKEENWIDPQFPIIHYTRWQRIKKVLKLLRLYGDDEEVKGFKEWLESELTFYKEKKDKKKVDLLEKTLKEVESFGTK